MYKRYIHKIFCFNKIIAILIVLNFVNINFLLADGEKGYKIKVVVIDAGHGGKDPGAVCPTGYEKDIALSIALKTGKYIEENIEGVKVIYTRDDDTFVELYKRAKIANDNKADLFISIHANANTSSKPFGCETYVMGLSKSASNLEVAKKENSVILKEDDYAAQYEGFDPNSPESIIIFSLYQNAYLDQSLDLASKIQNQFKEKVQRHDRGVKQERFLVLWKTTMPSILIELGFISNPTEAKFLFSEEGQDYMASSIYRAFKTYKHEIEKNSEETEPEKVEIPIKIDSTNNKNNIIFTIQILSSTTKIPLKPKNFNGLKDVKEFELDGIYKYIVGEESEFGKIIEYQKNIRKKYRDAFVIALENGKKISVKQALEEIKN